VLVFDEQMTQYDCTDLPFAATTPGSGGSRRGRGQQFSRRLFLCVWV